MLLYKMKSFWNKIKKQYNIKLMKSPSLQIFAVILYLDIYLDFLRIPKFIIEKGCDLAFWNFVIQVVIMVALAMLLAPKTKTPKIKPLGLEEFDIPTAEEGRSIQVLFGKKYIASPNVVWFGHLKSQAVKK